MKTTMPHLPRIGSIALLSLAILSAPSMAENTSQAEATDKSDTSSAPEQEKTAPLKTRLFLTNGDKLSGLPQSIDKDSNLLFKSESLRQIADFPLDNILSIHLDSWKQLPTSKTIARIQLHPRFRETNGDTILGELEELTPDSIKLKTRYGGVINLKRSMVKSLKIISNTPGNYHGPNNIKEWTLTEDDDSWIFRNGALVSHKSGAIGRDMRLSEKSHVGFDINWQSTMRFKLQLYSSDITSKNPDAYYEVNINRSYARMTTRGKKKGAGRMLGGGQMKHIKVNREKNDVHFDFYINRKTGSITIYLDGLQAWILQSQSPDPENLGTGLAFIAEARYPVKVSGLTVTPWNGTTLPKPANRVDPKKDDPNEKEETTKKINPHIIILNNGDEIPGTVGKVHDGRMIIETEYTPIHIPLERIQSLSLGDQGEEPIKKRGDVRAWFHNGGHITFDLTSFEDRKISGYSQSYGTVTFDISAFSRIDFHIYDKKANALRKKIH